MTVRATDLTTRNGHSHPAPQLAIAGAASGDVHARLAEAEETLRAIRNGEVDALVVRDGAQSAQVFTLLSADRPYRMFVENMRDGAATVSDSGIVLYANRRLSELLARPLRNIIGSPITAIIAESHWATLRPLGERARAGVTLDAELLAEPGTVAPVRINSSSLDVESREVVCLTFADLTQQHAQTREIDLLGRAQAMRMEELEHAQAALITQATHDTLTGLPNRSLLMDRLTQSLALDTRSGTATGVLFVDLDCFKDINDTRGHVFGDLVLREFSHRLQAAVRPMDSVSRLGGDEFVVLLPNLSGVLGAIAIAERIAATLARPIEFDGHALVLTASIGVTISDRSMLASEQAPRRLLQEADAAMYEAKSLGGSRTELFDPGRMSDSLRDNRETWITRISEALDDGLFVLHAQPIIELATGEVVQQELLLRMCDRDGSLIPPLAFLPTAERCRLIRGIDEWVITQATELAARGNTVCVNLSAASAGDPRVLDLVERELRSRDGDPGKLVFEITETAVMKNVDRARLFADRLIALGCRIALDDFGTGFASFTYLRQLPVQYLKIDVDFVRNLTRSPQDVYLVRAIVTLASDFGQETIAEGVEDEDTANMLRALGVTYAQGYLFGRPSPIAA